MADEDPEFEQIVESVETLEACAIAHELRQTGPRVRQDTKWGGPEHDDTHTHTDWINLIDKRLAPPVSHRTPAVEYRRAMIEIAALAIAAVESFDREAEQL